MCFYLSIDTCRLNGGNLGAVVLLRARKRSQERCSAQRLRPRTRARAVLALSDTVRSPWAIRGSWNKTPFPTLEGKGSCSSTQRGERTSSQLSRLAPAPRQPAMPPATERSARATGTEGNAPPRRRPTKQHTESRGRAHRVQGSVVELQLPHRAVQLILRCRCVRRVMIDIAWAGVQGFRGAGCSTRVVAKDTCTRAVARARASATATATAPATATACSAGYRTADRRTGERRRELGCRRCKT